MCVDEQTHQRVDDDQCDDDDGHGHSSIIFFPRGSTMPPVGSAVTGGVRKVPQGATSARGGAPRQGGTVQRGGFGGSGAKGGGAKGGGGKGGSVGG
jgi:hypothetical protein